MYKAEIVEAENENEAYEMARELGEEAVATWVNYDDVRASAMADCGYEPDGDKEPDEDEIEALIDEYWADEMDYWALKIKDDYQSMKIEELEDILNVEMGVDDFSKEYCER
jgi:hypothetical protein